MFMILGTIHIFIYLILRIRSAQLKIAQDGYNKVAKQRAQWVEEEA